MSTSIRYLWLVGGLVFAMLLWAYFEPIPEHTHADIQLGPSSPLYGPLNGRGK